MNYELFEDSDSIDPIFILSFERPAEFRPRLGDQIKLQNDLRIFQVNRSDPTNNPDDQKVKYFVNVFVDKSRSLFDIIVQTDPMNVP